jgi:hypothetical protein
MIGSCTALPDELVRCGPSGVPDDLISEVGEALTHGLSTLQAQEAGSNQASQPSRNREAGTADRDYSHATFDLRSVT